MSSMPYTCGYLKGDILQTCFLERGPNILLRKPSFVCDDVTRVLGKYFMRRSSMNKICDEQRPPGV